MTRSSTNSTIAIVRKPTIGFATTDGRSSSRSPSRTPIGVREHGERGLGLPVHVGIGIPMTVFEDFDPPAPDGVIVEIVDLVYLPLVGGRSPGSDGPR